MGNSIVGKTRKKYIYLLRPVGTEDTSKLAAALVLGKSLCGYVLAQ